MIKALSCIFVGVLLSFGFFPFEFTFLSGMNTKMLMAAVGLALLFFHMARKRDSIISHDFFVVSIFGFIVSLAGALSCAFNDTSDYTYATYLVSMLVWSGSAYLILHAIRMVHGTSSVRLLANYLIAVCVAQCALALAMDFYMPLKRMVDSFVLTDSFMGEHKERLYGLGCALDVAGIRFTAVLIILAHVCAEAARTRYARYMPLYLLAFIFIALVGNMIGRTTLVGCALALCYWVCRSGILQLRIKAGELRLWRCFGVILLVCIPLIVAAYYLDPAINSHIRFAFEGFFSLVEKGHWEVHSNDRLANMVVFPDNLKTWVIGDGYFNNPLSSNPYYIGRGAGEFYMYTDIGYLRFIFYFGVVGALAFCVFMYKVATVCMQRFRSYRVMVLLILLANYIIWFKVATDLYLVFALLLCIGQEENDRDQEQSLLQP